MDIKKRADRYMRDEEVRQGDILRIKKNIPREIYIERNGVLGVRKKSADDNEEGGGGEGEGKEEYKEEGGGSVCVGAERGWMMRRQGRGGSI